MSTASGQPGQNESRFDRRDFMHRVAGGIYGTALASLLARESKGAVRASHFEPKAKAVIQLFMNGGPSQMDLFDPKPMLEKHHGEAYFGKIAAEVEFVAEAGALLRSPFKFAQHGQSGTWLSETLPYLAKQVDELTVVRSMFTVNNTHEPALYKIHSGQILSGYPSMGAWVSYGLGSENDNLPGYVVLDDPLGLPVNGVANWQAAFLPPQFQGTRFRSTGTPVLNLKPAFDEAEAIVTTERGLISGLNRLHQQSRPAQPELAARISSYELAARMQLSATDCLDLSQESAATLAMYGVGEKDTDSYGRRCLMARRLVERGVRFVQIFINGQIWDTHNEISTSLKQACDRTDKPVAGLLQDLRQRGLLDETLVLWGGEFGRLPLAQLRAGTDEKLAGRDHNKNAFTLWMAGAGLKRGTVYGTTDDFGLAAVEHRVSVPDWHATILHLLGLRYDQLTVDVNGLKQKLTGTFEAHVIKDILA